MQSVLFSRSTDVTSTDLVSAKGKQRKRIVVCSSSDRSILMFLVREDYSVVSVYWNIVWWGCETISISWLLFSPLPKLGQLISGCDVSWPREWWRVGCQGSTSSGRAVSTITIETYSHGHHRIRVCRKFNGATPAADVSDDHEHEHTEVVLHPSDADDQYNWANVVTHYSLLKIFICDEMVAVQLLRQK